MATRKDPGNTRPTRPTEADVDFAGYDPYIVAITGGAPVGVTSEAPATAEQSTESRKVKLMAWLREHGA